MLGFTKRLPGVVEHYTSFTPMSNPMKRPLPLRILPDCLKEKLYYHFYHARHSGWRRLFECAPLTFAPGVAMKGLLTGDVISGNIAFNGFYELALTRQIVKLAGQGGLLVDVGANMGYFSLLWAGANPTSRVIAFEAAPRNIALMGNNITQNRLSERITLVPKAAGNRSGSIAFEVGPDDQTGWGGISATGSSTHITVPLVRLDQELPDADIAVLKIDVEGADTWVLLGSEELLRNRRVGTIFFEQHKARMEQLGITKGEAQSFLRGLGYTCVHLDGDESVCSEWMAFPDT